MDEWRVAAWDGMAHERRVNALMMRFPNAQDVRQGEWCHCKRGVLLSFTLPEFPGGREGSEYCGFWCSACGFSNAGTRPIDDKGLY